MRAGSSTSMTRPPRPGKGVAVLDGRLIENLHAAEARRVIALAEAIEVLESAATAGA